MAVITRADDRVQPKAWEVEGCSLVLAIDGEPVTASVDRLARWAYTHLRLKSKEHAASCTTNCLAPLAKVLQETVAVVGYHGATVGCVKALRDLALELAGWPDDK